MEVKVENGRIVVFFDGRIFEFAETDRWPALGRCCDDIHSTAGIDYLYFNVYVCARHYKMPFEVAKLFGYNPIYIASTLFDEVQGPCYFCDQLTSKYICDLCKRELLEAIYNSPDKGKLLDGSYC